MYHKSYAHTLIAYVHSNILLISRKPLLLREKPPRLLLSGKTIRIDWMSLKDRKYMCLHFLPMY